VAEGFGKSMSHPGGNMTGFLGVGDVPGKRIELFKEVVPRLRRLLVLTDPKDPAAERSLAELRTAAKNLKLILVERRATPQADIERVFGSLKQGGVDGIFVLSQSLNLKFPSLMVHLSAEKRLPFAGYRKEWVEQGAFFLMLTTSRRLGRLQPATSTEFSRAPSQRMSRSRKHLTSISLLTSRRLSR